jgi:hypothetical protein
MESHTKIYSTKKRHADGGSKLLSLLSGTDRDLFRQDPDRTEHVQNENTSTVIFQSENVRPELNVH